MLFLKNNKHLDVNKFENLYPKSIGIICGNAYDVVMPGHVMTVATTNQNEISLLLKVAKLERGKRYLGFVQGKENGSYNFFRTGVLCRLLQLRKDKSGRFIAKLQGVLRFNWRAELLDHRCSYRVLHVDYSNYLKDLFDNKNAILAGNDADINISTGDSCAREDSMLRLKLIRSISLLAEKNGKKINWSNVNKMSLRAIIASSINSVKLSVLERQAVIEALQIKQQAETLMGLIEISMHQQQGIAVSKGHNKGHKKLSNDKITLH